MFSFFLFRTAPFHSLKAQSSNFAQSTGSSKELNPDKRSHFSIQQKPNASFSFKTNELHCPGPKSSALNSVVQEPDLNNPPDHKLKQKKKKKKRQHFEVEADTKPFMSPAPVTQFSPLKSTRENKCKKKKKKQKRENEDGEKNKQREHVPSHLERCKDEEDWCQSGTWCLTPPLDAEQSKQKTQLSATTSTCCTSNQNEQEKNLVFKKKKNQGVAMQDTSYACSASERWVFFCDVYLFVPFKTRS